MKKVSLVRTYTSCDGVYFKTDRTPIRNFAFTLSMAARFPLVKCSQIIAMPCVIIGVIFNSNNFIAVFSDSFGRYSELMEKDVYR